MRFSAVHFSSTNVARHPTTCIDDAPKKGAVSPRLQIYKERNRRNSQFCAFLQKRLPSFPVPANSKLASVQTRPHDGVQAGLLPKKSNCAMAARRAIFYKFKSERKFKETQFQVPVAVEHVKNWLKEQIQIPPTEDLLVYLDPAAKPAATRKVVVEYALSEDHYLYGGERILLKRLPVDQAKPPAAEQQQQDDDAAPGRSDGRRAASSYHAASNGAESSAASLHSDFSSSAAVETAPARGSERAARAGAPDAKAGSMNSSVPSRTTENGRETAATASRADDEEDKIEKMLLGDDPSVDPSPHRESRPHRMIPRHDLGPSSGPMRMQHGVGAENRRAYPYRPHPKMVPRANVTCDICRKAGHMSRDCPNKADHNNRKTIKTAAGVPRDRFKIISREEAEHYQGDVFRLLDGALAILKDEHVLGDNVFSSSSEAAGAIKCQLCKIPMVDAVVTPCCGNSACRQCILESLNVKQQRPFKCPLCLAPITDVKVYRNGLSRNEVLNQMASGYFKKY
eukprot:GHVU01223892.1.p1 GENE.GHVU01223892.1~~GHVU01223892.1.p1  ORF type:complete len:511 (-),score=54.47 GHVU01223892.1:249-1781(-)